MTQCDDNLTYIIGDGRVYTYRFRPYDNLLCEFLNELSVELRSSQGAFEYADVMAFAFWCRKANIVKCKTDFGGTNESRLGLGNVFHVTPSNVPINFAFSFAFGLLAGNANIVRVPTKPSPQSDIIYKALEKLFSFDKFLQIKLMTTFVRYEKNDDITRYFSELSDARIIWGGDDTIRYIRNISVPERCTEIVFADRYSVSVLDVNAVMALSRKELTVLAEMFYNDTYLMDQKACSSPHLIVWLGMSDGLTKERFWQALLGVVKKKYQLDMINAVDKYTLLCQNAMDLNHIYSVRRYGNWLTRVTLNKVFDNTDDLRGQFGYFYEYDVSTVNSIAHIINAKYQTLTYFGVNKYELLDFVINNHLAGIDRIVPIGKALDMGVIWDGYDLVRSLSRVIDLK